MPRIEQTLILKYTNNSIIKQWLKSNLKEITKKTNSTILNIESLGTREMASTVLSEPADYNNINETEFIKPDFGIYKRHQHATIINLDMLIGQHHINDLQYYFHEHPQILRTSYKEHEMFSYDLDKAKYCTGIDYTDWNALAKRKFIEAHGSASAGSDNAIFRPKKRLVQQKRLDNLKESLDHFRKQERNVTALNMTAGSGRQATTGFQGVFDMTMNVQLKVPRKRKVKDVIFVSIPTKKLKLKLELVADGSDNENKKIDKTLEDDLSTILSDCDLDENIKIKQLSFIEDKNTLVIDASKSSNTATYQLSAESSQVLVDNTQEQKFLKNLAKRAAENSISEREIQKTLNNLFEIELDTRTEFDEIEYDEIKKDAYFEKEMVHDKEFEYDSNDEDLEEYDYQKEEITWENF